tara:strand:+ start:90 stop:551 length:462 start_codon:yes stop_codon:yes gene_type:complete
MNIRDVIEDKYKNAIKARNQDEINTLRLVKSAIKDKDILARSGRDKKNIEDPSIISLLQSLIKQRNDSIESFKLAARNDLIAIEQIEIDIISKFLPKQKNEEETLVILDSIIFSKKLTSIRDMGIIMNELKSNFAGTVDMALAGKIAKSKLSN